MFLIQHSEKRKSYNVQLARKNSEKRIGKTLKNFLRLEETQKARHYS